MSKEQLVPLIQDIAPQYGLEPEWVEAVVKIESNYQTIAYRFESHIRDMSVGPGQILTSTALWLAREGHVDPEAARRILIASAESYDSGMRPLVRVLEDPVINLHLTCAYLKWQMNRYGDIEDAVAAYNAGSVRRKADGSYINQWHVDKFNTALAGGD